jgi:hypothetical protein
MSGEVGCLQEGAASTGDALPGIAEGQFNTVPIAMI